MSPAPSLVGGMPLYVSGEDAIRLTAFNAQAGVALALRGRFLPIRQSATDPDPRVGAFAHPLVPATDRTESTRTAVLGEGWLLDCSVVATAGTPTIGQTFVVVSIARGQTGATVDLSTLAQGYVTATQRVAWPGSPLRSSLDGPGTLRSIAGTNPAAGAELSETVPAGVRWSLLAFTAFLVSSTAAGTRVVTMTLDDGATVYLALAALGTQGISQTLRYVASGATGQLGPVSGLMSIELPQPTILTTGHRLQTVTAQIDVADNWGAPQYLVEEWMVP